MANKNEDGPKTFHYVVAWLPDNPAAEVHRRYAKDSLPELQGDHVASTLMFLQSNR